MRSPSWLRNTRRSSLSGVPDFEKKLGLLAYDLSIELIRQLRDTLAIVRRHDAALAKHGRDALNSVALNLAEGRGRAGGDRQHCFTIALGSLREVSAVLEIAAAHGWLAELPCAAQRHRLGGMIYALARR